MRFPMRRPTLAAALLVALVRPAGATPLDDGHVGGIGFEGPTEGNVTSVYWNPAALGLIRGVQIVVSGTATWTTTTVERAPIDPATGLPGGSQTFPSARNTDLVQPLQYPVGPGGFFGAAGNLGERFTLAFATYAPYIDHGGFSPAASGGEPARFHRVFTDLRNVALVPALAVRISGKLRIGVAPGFLFSSGRMRFDEDTAPFQPACAGGVCSAEDPAHAARYDLGSDMSLLNSRVTMTVGAGAYYRIGDVELGLSFSSRPLGNGAGRVQVNATDARITLPGGGELCSLAPGAPSGLRCVSGDISYSLPDTWIAGVAWRHGPRLKLHATLRYITFSMHDRIDVRVIGPATGSSSLASQGLPESIRFHRGFKDAWDLRIGAELWPTSRLRVGVTGRMQTSAVPSSNVTPGAVDGLKLQPLIVAQAHILPHVWLSAGYGFVWMPSVTVRGPYDPTAVSACAAAGGDLAHPACRLRQQGLARPTADGTYSQHAHELSVSMTAQF